MSRVGLKPINLPDKVKVNVVERKIIVNGPKGELQVNLPDGIKLSNEKNIVSFSRENETKKMKSLHGMVRALTAGAIEGVEKGIKKVLKIEGIGYKAEMKGKNLMIALGFSHPIVIVPPDGIVLAAPKPTIIEISGIDKQLVGETAAVIRKQRKPEPYKGKGIRYDGEYVRRKAGKTATK